MKLSLKLEYACQVLAQLGKHYGSKDLPHIESLSKAESIPSNYLVQILNDLKNAGLIISRRGKQGGYALAKDPKEISLFDIVVGIDGELLGYSAVGDGESSRATSAAWKEVSEVLRKKTKSITVENLMTSSADPMWYI